MRRMNLCGSSFARITAALFHVVVNLSPSRLAAIVTTVRNLDGVTICRYGAAIQEWPTWTNGWIDAISLEAWAWRPHDLSNGARRRSGSSSIERAYPCRRRNQRRGWISRRAQDRDDYGG